MFPKFKRKSRWYYMKFQSKVLWKYIRFSISYRHKLRVAYWPDSSSKHRMLYIVLYWLSFKSESSNGSRMQSKKGSKNILNNRTNQTAAFSMLLLEFCVQNVRDRNNIVCIILILYFFLELYGRVCIVPYHYWPTKYRSAAISNSHHNGEIKLKPIASSRRLKNGFTKNINHKQVQSALIIIIYCIHWWKR